MSTRRAVLALLAVSFPGAWIGCNAILGNDPASFVPPEGGGTGDGTGGDDGPSPMGDGAGDDGADAADVITCDADFANDPANCGACNHDCVGGGCEAGACGTVLLATDPSRISGAAVDTQHVYWTNIAGELRRAPLVGGDGGAGETLFVAPPSTFLTHVASSGSKVYVGMATATDGGLIAACDVTGCPVAPPIVATPQSLHALLIGGPSPGSLYWTDGINDGGVMTCALPACSSPTALASTQRFPDALTIDGAEILWSSDVGGYVHAVPLAGGIPHSLVEDAGGPAPYGIAVSGDRLYFSRLGAGIDFAPRAGGVPSSFTTSATQVHSLAADGTYVYLADESLNNVFRCPRTDCSSLTVIAHSDVVPILVFIDPQSLVWVFADVFASGQPSTIWRVAR
jgi:hypothetical protein